MRFMRAVATGSSEAAAPADPRQPPFNRLWLLLPLLAAAALLALDRTGIDLALTSRFYDPAARAFPLRTTFLFDTVIHHWTKYIVASIACLAWSGYVLTYAAPALRPHRRELLFLGLALGLAPAAVATLKLWSSRHCPWDIAEFGGFAPYLSLLDSTPPGFTPGHCFPAGHASTGFCLMAFYFVGLSSRRPAWAWSGLATGLLAGLALGLGRIAQGAHFVSHVLWSGIVCWIVLVGLHALILRHGAVGLQSTA
jgi:membrane-associated PAP2 superfamily phosphatase